MRHIWSATALVTALWLGVADARYTCTSVVRRGDTDPGGFVYTNKFEEPVGVNAGGDVAFVARAAKFQQTVYLYPNGGPNRVVARVADPAPGGSAYSRFAAGSFGSVSINTGGDVAFFAKLTLPGDGVFVDVGGTVEKAAQTTDATPNGGFFLNISSVSNINDFSAIAFVATVNGAPNGIFAYDAATNALVTVVDTADSDTLARAFCSFGEVGLPALSSAVIAFTASVANPTCATPLAGVFVSNGLSSIPIAMAGDATPIGGTTYVSFLDAPEISAAATVTFAARVTGATYTGDAIFSSSGPSKIVAVGDFAPDVTGAIKKLGGQHRQDGNGDVIARLFLRQTDDKEGIFRYDATPEAAVVKTDAPPVPFGAGSKYRKIGPVAAAGSGTRIAFRAKMKDTIKPGSKTGVLSCVP